MTSAYLSVIPEFQEKIDIISKSINGFDDNFEVTKTEIINKITGSRIIFRGIKSGSKDQTANLKSINGLTIWVLDEAEELTDEEKFDDIARSIRKKDEENKIILIFNPPTKSHWTYKRFFINNGVQPGSNLTKNNTTYIHTTYLDNEENLNKDFVEEANQMRIDNPDKWSRIYGGAYRDKAEGVIFKNWETGEFPKDVHSEYGLDFGFSVDPTALIKVYIDKKNKIIYLKQLIYQTGLTPSDLASLIKSKNVGKSLIIADNARPDLIEEIKRKGINVRGVKKPKIAERIKIQQDYKYVIDPKSKDLIEEFNNYVWDKNYDDRPIDDFNHAIDAKGYLIYYRTKNKKNKRYRIY